MKRSAWRGYGFAVLVVAVTVLIELVLAVTIDGGTPFLLLFFAVLVSAWRGGVGPGLLATALATLAADYFFVGPPYSFGIESLGQVVRLIQFVLEGAFATFLITALQSSSRRAEERSTEIDRYQDDLKESEERYRLVIEGSNDGVWDWDIRGGSVYWNDRLFEILGLSRSEVEPSFDLFVDLIHPDDRQRTRDALTAHLERGEGYEAEFRWRHASGEYRICLGRGKAQRDASGAPVRMTGTVQDITERKHRENSQHFMSEASAVLASSLDYQNTLASLAHLSVPFLADWCAVDVIGESGRVERLAVAHEDPEKVALARELQERYPTDPEARFGVPQVLRTGEPELVPEIPPALLDESAVDDEHRELIRRLGLRSYMVVPLLARGRTLGAITLVMSESGRRYGEEDLKTAEDLARRAAVAVDNALLYDEAQREISERERIEGELRRQRDLYETLLQAQSEVGEGFVIAEGPRISYANEAFCEISGYSERELLELPTFFELFAPEERAEFLERFSRRVSGEEGTSHQEITLLSKDGRRVDLEISVKELREDGVVRFVIITRDITDRKKTEEALRQSEERYRAVVEQAAEGIFLVDPDTKRFLEANAEYQKMLGYTSEELLGMTLYDVVAHDREDVDYSFQRSLEERSFVIGERRHRRKDNSLIYIMASSSLVFYGGRQVVCYVVHDITERKRFEDELEARAEELQKSNAELERFAYIASHDLQEPLRMVSSYTQLLARRYRGKLDQDADEFIEYAVDGATRMQTLINDLLTYSRVGTQGGELAPTDLSKVFAAARNNLQIAVEESGATVTSDDLPTVLGDFTQLVQLFQNLIGNAIKFRGEEPPEIRVGVERRGRDWELRVQDNGIGIEPRYAERVFVIFQRLHTREDYPGTGIGLAVSKRIVERHGGRMWIESEPGEGSTFFFTLPTIEGE